MTKIRSFLAFDIPPEVKQKLSRLISDFSKKEKGVKWLNASLLHVTMKFFGDVEEELLMGDIVDSIGSVTSSCAPVSLDCQGLGVFPNWKYPNVIWAGFLGDVELVLSMQAELEKALAKYPIKKDDRAFRLHLTIGRAKELKSTSLLMKQINELGPISFGKVVIDHLTLYKSVLTKEGSVYTALKKFDLKKDEARNRKSDVRSQTSDT
ncbi:MAG: RNA 2',3'-cyclic phosphodiesterase [Deltaproteobacteria bacterium CG11_big_fil_rev_8_21_14_0_20_49_13]|nr:MAG: RNA 2',3'-cyclic phosphodiesterase [Deltaproteobacteria bacterium CG11_big_fil_rev_8_21_14_0_20_49_13]